MGMITRTYEIRLLDSEKRTRGIVEFLFSEFSFDDTRYTPGEEEQLRTLPYRALAGQAVVWYALNEAGDIIAVSCVAENDQKTGDTAGITWSCTGNIAAGESRERCWSECWITCVRRPPDI